MKKHTLNIFTIVFLTISIVGCKKAKEADTIEAETVAVAKTVSAKYKVDSQTSTIEWKGFKPTGSHNGTIALKSGIFTTDNGKMNSGTFLIDMNSIKNTDIPADKEGNAKIVGHLKSADFFDVEKFPSAAFEVTGFEDQDGKTMLSGNLNLKGIKNNITFPVSVSKNGSELTLSSENFTIDRSKWNVKYGSKSFFDNLGDKFINDDIELKITVKAKKA